ncbi:uncharacterized protein LOC117566724 [Drosophila albomicans]|uniref:Uncharacterized protein LOC117566724 n=1 Tax=Drosophila albomicans TaxID=7291 RepID=A0A6P8WS31_DROAB|nr:uncharacterized protein LOC117566724 [Drosophila albomicans]
MATKILFPTFYDEKTKIWSGLPRQPFYDYNCSMGLVAFNSMKNYPNNVVQISDTDGRVVTYAESLAWATRLALYLKSEKLTHKDVIGIIGRASTYPHSLAVACLFNTTPFHAVAYTYMKEPEVIKELYELTKPSIMFVDAEDYEIMKQVCAEWNPKFITMTGRIEGIPNIEDLLKPHPMERFYQPERLAEGGDQTAVILCSSGTSGTAKAVCLSHRHVARTAQLTNSTDVVLTSATLDWMTGFSCTMLAYFFGSTQIIFNETFNAESFIRMTAKHKVTMYAMPPWQAYEVFTHPNATPENLASLKLVAIVGGWLTKAVLQKAKSVTKNCNICFTYGSTETSGVSMSLDVERDNSVGGLLHGNRVMVVDDDGNALGHNETGTILIDVGIKWKGYVNNPEETANAIKDCWIDLGDIGHFDDDNNLFLTDRKKDVLKYKSKDYWPNEIEQIICELPEVQNACVVGVRNVGRTDAAGALVIKNKGAEISKETIIEHVAKRVGVEYKQLHSGVQFVDAFPKNTNGKVLRNAARLLFESLAESN